MDDTKSHWGFRIWRGAKIVLWLLIGHIALMQFPAPNRLESARADLLDRFQEQRRSRVIAKIHRQDTVSLFGVPVSSSISIEDSEAVLRAIGLTPPEQPIDLILRTPGGLLLAAEQIAKALGAHEFVMDSNAVLGPVDPQIGDMPAASIVRMVELKKLSKVSDDMLVLADIAQKSRL